MDESDQTTTDPVLSCLFVMRWCSARSSLFPGVPAGLLVVLLLAVQDECYQSYSRIVGEQRKAWLCDVTQQQNLLWRGAFVGEFAADAQPEQQRHRLLLLRSSKKASSFGLTSTEEGASAKKKKAFIQTTLIILWQISRKKSGFKVGLKKVWIWLRRFLKRKNSGQNSLSETWCSGFTTPTTIPLLSYQKFG